MNAGDRQEFATQMKLLCAGYNVPMGDREAAYWKGLANMSLPEFARCVEYALGEDGPDRIPTTGQMWGIRKELRTRRATVPQIPLAELPYTDAERYANKMLMDWLNWNFRTAGVAPSEATARGMYVSAKELAGVYQGMLDEPDSGVTDLKFLEAFCEQVLTPHLTAAHARAYLGWRRSAGKSRAA